MSKKNLIEFDNRKGLRMEIDRCLKCNRPIKSWENYLEVPVRIDDAKGYMAVCANCETGFIDSLPLPAVIFDVTS